MSDQLSTAGADDIRDFKTLKTGAIEDFNQIAERYQKCAEKLLVIKKRELWRAEQHKNWSEFLDSFAEGLGKSPRRLFQMIRAAETKSKLLKLFQEKSPNLSKTVEKMTEKAISELANVPEEERGEVIEAAAKQFGGKAPTAPAIAAAAKAHKPKGEKPPTPLDATGTKITNKDIWQFWERRDEVQPWLTELTKIKSEIKKALEAGDPLYVFIGNAVIGDISKLYVSLSNAKLHALCTDCQGWPETKGKSGCGTCHGTGFISKAAWDRDSKSEVKQMRARAAAQA